MLTIGKTFAPIPHEQESTLRPLIIRSKQSHLKVIIQVLRGPQREQAFAEKRPLTLNSQLVAVAARFPGEREDGTRLISIQ